jgi:hypothetical protein
LPVLYQAPEEIIWYETSCFELVSLFEQMSSEKTQLQTLPQQLTLGFLSAMIV